MAGRPTDRPNECCRHALTRETLLARIGYELVPITSVRESDIIIARPREVKPQAGRFTPNAVAVQRVNKTWRATFLVRFQGITVSTAGKAPMRTPSYARAFLSPPIYECMWRLANSAGFLEQLTRAGRSEVTRAPAAVEANAAETARSSAAVINDRMPPQPAKDSSLGKHVACVAAGGDRRWH